MGPTERPKFSRPLAVTDSGFIREMRYARNAKVLELVMVSGNRYRYYGVGTRKALNLADAPSAGRYYNAQIKGRHPRRKFRPTITREAAVENARLGATEMRVAYAVPLSPGWRLGPGLFHFGGSMDVPGGSLLEVFSEDYEDAVITRADWFGHI